MILSKQYYTFFLIIPPGLEELAKSELIEKSAYIDDYDIPEICLESGGIEIQTDLLTGFKLNYYLKIPTRILLRIDSFKCRDFPKLYKKVSKYKWSDYLNEPKLKVSASSTKSRLINTKRIEKAVTDGIEHFFKANTPSKSMLKKEIPYLPNVFIRVIDDIVTLSIDTTGDRLNIRSYRTHIAQAPIRENLASAMVYALNDYHCTRLIDPMCGSGTNLFEAINFYSLNKRQFIFESFNIINAYPPISIGEYSTPIRYSTLQGYDIEQRNIEICESNYQNLLTKLPIQFKQADLFEDEKLMFTEDTAVIVNPPYGKRIKVSEDMKKYFETILFFIQKKFHPKVIGIIIPAEINYNTLNINNYKIQKSYRLKNGGIRINYLVIHKN